MDTPLPRLTLEVIQSLPDELLVQTADLAQHDVADLIRVSHWLDAEVLRRMRSTNPTAKRLATPSAFANAKSTPTYDWNVAAVKELFGNQLTGDEWQKIFRVTEPKPQPPPTTTIVTQAAKAAAKRLGIEDELMKHCVVGESVPKLAYERRDVTIEVQFHPEEEIPFE